MVSFNHFATLLFRKIHKQETEIEYVMSSCQMQQKYVNKAAFNAQWQSVSYYNVRFWTN